MKKQAPLQALSDQSKGYPSLLLGRVRWWGVEWVNGWGGGGGGWASEWEERMGRRWLARSAPTFAGSVNVSGVEGGESCLGMGRQAVKDVVKDRPPVPPCQLPCALQAATVNVKGAFLLLVLQLFL